MIRLKQVILDAPSSDDKKVSVQVVSGAAARLGLTDTPVLQTAPSGTTDEAAATAAPKPVFATEAEKQAARVVIEVIVRPFGGGSTLHSSMHCSLTLRLVR